MMPESRILIVEDEGIAALDLQKMLTALGYSALDIVSTGEDAVREAGERVPNLVLMDIMLQGEIDGVTAAEQIRALFDIPVIYITAYADEATLQRAKITEPYAYLVKPYKERELYITIDMALYRHKVQRELKESREWLATTLKSIGDAVIATDREGLITFMNPVAEGMLGWKLDEVSGKKLTDVFNIINRDTRQPAENPVLKVLREGFTVGLANHTVLIARSGAEIPIDDSAAPIKDDKENIIGVILVFRDITEREKAEEALQESEQRYATTLASIGDAVIATDTAGRITFMNFVAEELTGWTIEEAGQKPVREVFNIINEQTRLEIEDPVANVLEKGKIAGLANHTILLRKDGTEVPIDDSAAPIRDRSGSIVGVVLVFRDIAERKQLEIELREHRDHLEELVAERTKELVSSNEQLQKEIAERKLAQERIKKLNRDLNRRAEELTKINKELESFSYSISHDLRAPLRAINGFSQMLSNKYQDKLDDEGKEDIQIICSECNRMSDLINGILNLSRLSRKELHRGELDLSTVAETIALELRRSEPGRQVDFIITPGIKANGDRVLLQSVLQNLLDNAWKFTGKHEKARIEFGVTEQAGKKAYFVRDDGAGFDMRYVDKLFGTFQRLHGVNEFSGNGIGLAIIQRIVHHHGGQVWAEGEVEKGATFYFTLHEQSDEDE